MEIPDTIQFCLCFNLAKVTLSSNCCKYILLGDIYKPCGSTRGRERVKKCQKLSTWFDDGPLQR